MKIIMVNNQLASDKELTGADNERNQNMDKHCESLTKFMVKSTNVSHENLESENLMKNCAVNNTDNNVELAGDTKQSIPDINYYEKEEKEAWLTVVLVFLFYTFIGINFVMFPVLYVHLTDYFESDKATTGWIGSIQKGTCMTLGVVMSSLVNKYGCRLLALAGSITYVIGIGLSAFVPQIWCLLITFGVVAGIGLSILYITSPVIIQRMFQKYRVLATGITLLGASVGNMVGPVLTETIVEHYGWRGALLLMSALLSHMIPLSLMLPLFNAEKRSIKNISYTKSNQLALTDDKRSILAPCLDLCDFSLMKNPSFLLFCFSFMTFMFNTIAMYDHVIGRAIVYGVSSHKAAYLVSSIALGITFTRIICSFVANLQCSNCLVIYTVGVLLGALSSLALTLMTEFYGMLIVSFIHGIHLGFSFTVVTVCAVYMVGTENIASAQGLLNLFHGIAGFIAVPFTGWLYDITKNYNIPFYITGSIGLVGTICSFLSFLITCCKSRPEVTTEEYITTSQELYTNTKQPFVNEV